MDCDIGRTRAAFAQLAAGICALHESGKMHRDLKPSNVLVTMEGRVVIVDFGLISDLSGTQDAARSLIAGTPAYMAPELLMSNASAAADWYSAGVMLFEALVGRLPSADDLSDTVSPACFPGCCAPDLVELCRALLRRNPLDRPSGREVLGRFAASEPAEYSPGAEPPLIGREQELVRIRGALQGVLEGGAATVLVTGKSGVGKTALIRRFLRDLGTTASLVVSGRCYEQELIPYNALDEIVDAIAAYLRSLPSRQRNAIVDRDTALAARILPALSGNESGAVPMGERIESNELRQAAFTAFRILLTRLAADRPVVIHIDDLHWAHDDSLRLLAEVLRPPRIARLLLILSSRADDSASQRALAALLHGQPEPGRPLLVELQELSPADAENLASLLSPSASADETAAIAKESAGNPFLLTELAHYTQSRMQAEKNALVSLEQMLLSRVDRLPAAARQLLETVAIAGRPVDSRLALKAACQDRASRSAIADLRARRLIRIEQGSERREIDAYHDRIRQAVVNGMPPERRSRRHLDIALEFEASERGGPEFLALHFRAGDDKPKASHYSVVAARLAYQALAFENAARWYREALDLAPQAGKEQWPLRIGLADALSSAGRNAEAARIYRDCANHADADRQLELKRKAAAELLISGETEEGMTALGQVLEAVGMRMPRTSRHAIPMLLFDRLRLSWRGLDFHPRAPSRGQQELRRADACWTVAQGLYLVDPIRAAHFHSRHLLLALQIGDVYRVARALSIEAAYTAFTGGKARRKTAALLQRAQRVAADSGHDHAIALARVAQGMIAFLEGRWAEARESLNGAERSLRERCAGVAWDLATVRLVHCAALLMLGELGAMSSIGPEMLQGAEARGNRYESNYLQIVVGHGVHLTADRPDQADAHLEAAMAGRSRHHFYLPHWWALMARSQIWLYRGDVSASLELVQSNWGVIRHAGLMRIEYARVMSWFQRGTCRVAMAATSDGSRALLRGACKDAESIERLDGITWGRPLADLVRAGAASAGGNPEAALSYFTSAESAFRSHDMGLFAAVARMRIGALIRGEAGKSAVEAATAWMEGQGIRNPARMAAMYSPGFSALE
jgi:tetratricopeptide (TPR) repeat protein